MISYCNNNPVVLADKAGHAPWPTTVVINDGGSSPVVENTSVAFQVREATEEILAAFRPALARARTTKAILDCKDPNKAIHPEILVEFYNLVNHKMPWDIKREEVWTSTIGTPYPGFDTPVLFNGELMTPQMLGNYTYGYLGQAYGIPLPMLLAGSYYAANIPLSGDELANEIWDWGYIIKGYCDAQNYSLEEVEWV